MNDPTHRLDPQKLSPADAARLMSRVGGECVEESVIEADVTAGAPGSEDGAMNLDA